MSVLPALRAAARRPRIVRYSTRPWPRRTKRSTRRPTRPPKTTLRAMDPAEVARTGRRLVASRRRGRPGLVGAPALPGARPAGDAHLAGADLRRAVALARHLPVEAHRPALPDRSDGPPGGRGLDQLPRTARRAVLCQHHHPRGRGATRRPVRRRPPTVSRPRPLRWRATAPTWPTSPSSSTPCRACPCCSRSGLADDEFPAKVKVMYDREGARNLPLQDLRILADLLGAALKRAAAG